MTCQSRESEDLAGRLRLSVARLARVTRQQDGLGMDLTPTETAMLATIAWEGEPTLGMLAATEHVAPPTVTKAIGNLEAAGYIERLPDPNDRRVCRVRLSAAGERMADVYRERVNAWLATQLEGLSDRERDQVAAAVDILEHFVKVGQAEQEHADDAPRG